MIIPDDMTSNRPYLLRALYEWILDNGLTPYIVVDTTVSVMEIPHDHIEDNQITFNVHPDAVHNLVIDNDAINFSARFSGNAMNIHVPISAVMAIYARENGKGLVFPEEPEDPETYRAEKTTGKPHLTVVK